MQFSLCLEAVLSERLVWVRRPCGVAQDVYYGRHGNLLTSNTTSPPPHSLDCKWGHFPLLEIINYTLYPKENIRLNITAAMLAASVGECVSARVAVLVRTRPC